VWAAKHWTMQPTTYASVNDSVTAALGATYCPSILYIGDDDQQAQFLREAAAALHGPA
jgi:hypothetical protein